MKPYRNSKHIQLRGKGGQFRRASLNDFNLGTAPCPHCDALNPYTLIYFVEVDGFTQQKHSARPTICAVCGKSLTDDIDYSADADSGDAERITPDAAGENWAPEPERPVDILRTAHTYRAIMRRLYGTNSAQAQRAAAVFDNLFAVRNVKFA